MIRIEELLHPGTDLRRYAGNPLTNAFLEADALREAQLLEIWHDALRSAAGLLFELRTSLQYDDANTGVLVARGVRELSWTAPPRVTARTAWTVDGSRIGPENGLSRLHMAFWPAPGAVLTVRAEQLVFIGGDVPGLDEAPPDYGSSDERQLRASLAGWRSEFTPRHAVFLPTRTDG